MELVLVKYLTLLWILAPFGLNASDVIFEDVSLLKARYEHVGNISVVGPIASSDFSHSRYGKQRFCAVIISAAPNPTKIV